MSENSRPSSGSVTLVLVLALLLGVTVGAVVVVLAAEDDGEVAAPDGRPPDAGAPPEPAGPALAEGGGVLRPVPSPDPAAEATMVDLPDGGRVPALNGVVGEVNFNWTKNHPYSPIVGLRPAVGPDGWEWYEHADGSLSTTIMIFRQDLGRREPFSLVATPQKGVPMNPRLAQKMYEDGLLGSNPPARRQ